MKCDSTVAGLLAAILAVSASGCGSDGIVGTDTDNGLEENLGRPLTESGAVAEQSPVFWSADGTEVYFEARDQWDLLLAVRVADGVIRDVSLSPTPAVAFAASKDGQWIYRTRWPSIPWASEEGGAILERFPVTGGPAEILASNVMHWGEQFSPAMVPFSPDGSSLAHATVGDDADPADATVGRRDTLHVLDLDSGERTTLAFGRPLAFSPDGDRLLFESRPCDIDGSSFRCAPYILDLATGSQEAAPPRVVRMTVGSIVWWNESGIQILGSSPSDTYTTWNVENLSRGTVEVVHEMERFKEMAHLSRWKVCSDGSRVAGWTDHFADGYQAVHGADLGTTHRWTAVINFTAQGWHSAFSPDCERLAYVVGSRLFVQDL